jgi:succinate dehydrogenase/fumarate reductase flavoprotein subunit
MLLTISQLPEGASFDVVVVGAGGAGMVAALLAAIKGLKVLLIEHTKHVGGTAALSAGSAWIPNTHHAANVSPPDSVDRAATYLRNAVGNLSSEEMRRAFLIHGPKAIAELEAQTDVTFRARSLHPDYQTELEGSTLRGRVLEAMPFDGRKLGSLLSLIREPIPEFTVLGGMMVNQEDVGHLVNMSRSWTSLKHGTKIILRHVRDRLAHKRGTRLMMGNALVGRLLYSLSKRNVSLMLEAKVARIDAPDAEIAGLSIQQRGKERRITVGRGVIMATGGFNRHPKLRNELLRKPVADYCPGAPGHTGQLHDLVMDIGGSYGEGPADSAFWAPVSVRKRTDGSIAVFPHFLLDRGKPGTVAVNKAGLRFVNEAVSYHPFVEGMYRNAAGEPSIPAFLITDADGLWKYGLGMVRPGPWSKAKFLADGYLVRATTIAGLADKLGVASDGLQQTIARMNDYARSGIDPEFGRGSTDYQRITAGDLAHAPNPCLGPIQKPPFYAIRLFPGDIGASKGFLTDLDAQVLDKNNAPIRGLYACGNDMNSVMGGKYPGPGITIGPGIAFAYAAVNHLSQQA